MSIEQYGNLIRVRPARAGIPPDSEWHDTGHLGGKSYVPEAVPKGRNFMKKLTANVRYHFSTASHGTVLLIGLIGGGVLGGYIGKKLSGVRSLTELGQKIFKK